MRHLANMVRGDPIVVSAHGKDSIRNRLTRTHEVLNAHHHHLRQPLQAQGEPGGNADQGCGDGLPADENRREVPDQTPEGTIADLRLLRLDAMLLSGEE